MTTPTITEAEAIARANAAYHRVMNSEWPAGKGDDIREALAGLLEARETYYAVLNRATDPSDAYFDLEPGDDALGQALGMSVKDTSDWAGELDRLVPVETESEVAA